MQMIERAKKWIKAALPKHILLRIRVRRTMRGSDDPEVKLLPVFARSGAFIDIGANMGGWSGPATKIFSQVHAFEPLAELAEALRQEAPINMQVHSLALSNRAGTARFSVPVHQGELLVTRASLEANANLGYREIARDVTLATLDSLEFKGIDAIKIDVEGHEEAVLAGAWVTIERERPALVIEIEERHHAGRSDAIIAAIVSRGYVCSFTRNGLIEPYFPGDIAKLQPNALLPTPGQRAAEYINNFVFTPEERKGDLNAMNAVLGGRQR